MDSLRILGEHEWGVLLELVQSMNVFLSWHKYSRVFVQEPLSGGCVCTHNRYTWCILPSANNKRGCSFFLGLKYSSTHTTPPTHTPLFQGSRAMGKTGTALITGGGGFVGARLAGRLVNDGYAEVRCVDIGFGPGGLAAAEPQHPKIKRIVSKRIDYLVV